MKFEFNHLEKSVLDSLSKKGRVYLVGGIVRDMVMYQKVDYHDVDVEIYDLEIDEIIDILSQYGKVNEVGKSFGILKLDCLPNFDFALPRIERKKGQTHREFEVEVHKNLDMKIACRRRDFTINAMAYNPSSGLVDLFGGLEDIERKIIRCVGDPLERFTEDALRIMRAVRFSAQLGFTIEEETRKALKVLAPNLKHVSAERIQVELVKLLMSPHPDYLRVAYEAGITAEFLPEFDACMTTSQNTPHHCYTVGEHILHSLCHVRADKVLRITMLLHDIGKPVVRKTDENGRDHFKMHGIAGEKMAAQILRRLKFDNDTIRKVTRLVKWHDDRPDGTTKAVRRAVNRIGEDLFPYYLEVQQADMLAQSDYRRAEKQKRLDRVKEAYEMIINEHQCVSLKTLAVTGKDLIEAGYKPGREIGETLNRLLEVVLVDPQKNQKEILLGLLDEK